MSADDTPALLELLGPILARVSRSAPAERTTEADARALRDQLEHDFPYEGELAQAIGAALQRGVEEGWLCNRGEQGARFSRVAKACEDTCGLSVDVVALEGAALAHRHPQGEVTLGFPAPGSGSEARFDGHPPGWVVMPAGSTHTPTVTHGRMHLIYFLPSGSIEWLPGA